MASTAEHQGIILPNVSLFLVDRGWSSLRKVSRKASVPASHEHMFHEDMSLGSGAVKAIKHPWAVSPRRGDHTRASDGPAQRSGEAKPTKPFEFVNVVRPGRAQDPEVRKLVKSHVKTGIKRGPNVKKLPRAVSVAVSVVSASSSDDSNSSSSASASSSSSSVEPLETDQESPLMLPPTPIDNPLPFFHNKTFSKLVGPRSQLLLNYYFHVVAPAWYPLEAHLTYNPVRVGWFSLAVRDDLLFLSILFSSASNLALTNGSGDHEESMVMVAPILRHLNERLQESPVPSDTTIGIVSCLAMVEMAAGNYDKWKLHMGAIQEMIRLRGGICNIDAFLQTKIVRADVEGASDTLTVPYLPALPRSPMPILSSLQDSTPSPTTQSNKLLTIMQAGGVSTSLQSVMLDLNRLAQGLSQSICDDHVPIDPRALDENLVQIHHSLLALITNSSGSQSTISPTDGINRDMEFNEAASIATLLCAKAINRRKSSTPPHPRAVMHRLTAALAPIHEILSFTEYVDVHVPEARFDLLLWIYFMGGMAARASEMDFFIDGLSYLMSHARHSKGIEIGADLRCQSWDEVKFQLGKIVWLPLVHDEPGKAIWELVMIRGFA